MIHIIIGTKAQFIKMIPVIKGLESRSISYNLIHLGQHAHTVKRLVKQFNVRQPDFELQSNKDVVTILGMIRWLCRLTLIIAFRKNYLKNVIFGGEEGIVLIHGDTLSTLIGLMMAKRGGLKVAHVESGLRSWSYFHPFPEELLRIVCMKFSDYLFAPSDEAVSNIGRMKVKGALFNTCGNTGMETAALAGPVADMHDLGRYVLVSIHRFENLFSRERFEFILNVVEEVSKKYKVLFVMHGPTEKKIKRLKRGILDIVESDDSLFSKPDKLSSVTYLPLQDYSTFMELIKNAEFIVTDGGSIQEECSYLGKPCLIMRKRIERTDGIGENALLCSFDMNLVDQFIGDYGTFRREAVSLKVGPSERLIEEILKIN